MNPRSYVSVGANTKEFSWVREASRPSRSGQNPSPFMECALHPPLAHLLPPTFGRSVLTDGEVDAEPISRETALENVRQAQGSNHCARPRDTSSSVIAELESIQMEHTTSPLPQLPSPTIPVILEGRNISYGCPRFRGHPDSDGRKTPRRRVGEA